MRFWGRRSQSFSVFLNFLAHQAAEYVKSGASPIILVIDELPYLASVDPGIAYRYPALVGR